jgi:SAM-dependent methyltransferase
MHAEAFDYVSRHATNEPLTVLDLGGRNVNGTVRPLFPAAAWTCLDITPGEGVDIVADAATWQPNGRSFDLVMSTELFEHTSSWPAVCATAYRSLKPGGRFIVTTAAPGRPAHSGIDGGPLRSGEWYANIDPGVLRVALVAAGFVAVEIDVQPVACDVRAVAAKP